MLLSEENAKYIGFFDRFLSMCLKSLATSLSSTLIQLNNFSFQHQRSWFIVVGSLEEVEKEITAKTQCGSISMATIRRRYMKFLLLLSPLENPVFATRVVSTEVQKLTIAFLKFCPRSQITRILSGWLNVWTCSLSLNTAENGTLVAGHFFCFFN